MIPPFLLASSPFLVIGGQSDYNKLIKKTEVIDLADSSNMTCTSAFWDLESERNGAIGGLINGTPILCGGEDSSNKRYGSCIVFGLTKTFIELKERRSYAASVMLNETTLWIMGGHSDSINENSSTTELITLDSATSVSGPVLPMGVYESCAVKYNQSHIYLTGGRGKSVEKWQHQNEVWIYNTLIDGGSSSWIEGPKMNRKRSEHGCTVLHHGLKSWIVVAGGSRQTVEILDPNTNKWVMGKNFVSAFRKDK